MSKDNAGRKNLVAPPPRRRGGRGGGSRNFGRRGQELGRPQKPFWGSPGSQAGPISPFGASLGTGEAGEALGGLGRLYVCTRKKVRKSLSFIW